MQICPGVVQKSKSCSKMYLLVCLQIDFECSAHHCTCTGQHAAIATRRTYSCCCGAGRDSSGVGGWTLTPTPPVWTQTPTEDSSCFADPENFDCACHAKKQRQCAYVPSSHCISCTYIQQTVMQKGRLPQRTSAGTSRQGLFGHAVRALLRLHTLIHMPGVRATPVHAPVRLAYLL